MSKYFVVKASGANISIPVLDEAPAKPYIPIKSKGYIPLTTETNTTGVKVKGRNGKAYRAKVATTTEMSSTYIGDYTTSTTYGSIIKQLVGTPYCTTTQVTNSEYTQKTITLVGGANLGILQTVSFTKSGLAAKTYSATAFGNQVEHNIYAGGIGRTTGFDASGYPKVEILKSYQYITLTLTYTSFISVNNFNTEPYTTSYTVKFTHHPTITGSNTSKWVYSFKPVVEDFTYTISSNKKATYRYTGTITISAELGNAYVTTNKVTSTETLGCEGYTFTSSFTHATYTGTFGAGYPLTNTKITTRDIGNVIEYSTTTSTKELDVRGWIMYSYRSASKTTNKGITTYIIPDYECTSYWTETTIV